MLTNQSYSLAWPQQNLSTLDISLSPLDPASFVLLTLTFGQPLTGVLLSSGSAGIPAANGTSGSFSAATTAASFDPDTRQLTVLLHGSEGNSTQVSCANAFSSTLWEMCSCDLDHYFCI